MYEKLLLQNWVDQSGSQLVEELVELLVLRFFDDFLERYFQESNCFAKFCNKIIKLFN